MNRAPASLAISLMLMLGSISVASLTAGLAEAGGPEAMVKTDKASYAVGDTVSISGIIGADLSEEPWDCVDFDGPVTIRVFNPDGVLFSEDEVCPDPFEGTYEHQIQITGPLAIEGTWSVQAAGGGQASTSFEVGDGCISDDEPPMVHVVSPSNGALIQGPSNGVMLNISGIVTDDGCGVDKVEVKIQDFATKEPVRWYREAKPTGQNGDWSEWHYDFKVYSEGQYRIVARVIDLAGNVNWNSVIVDVSFDQDMTQPLVAITSPLGGQVLGELTVTVTGTAFDSMSGVQKVEVRTESLPYHAATPSSPGDWSSWTDELTFDSEGLHTVVAKATDSAGNLKWTVIVVNVQFV